VVDIVDIVDIVDFGWIIENLWKSIYFSLFKAADHIEVGRKSKI